MPDISMEVPIQYLLRCNPSTGWPALTSHSHDMNNVAKIIADSTQPKAHGTPLIAAHTWRA